MVYAGVGVSGSQKSWKGKGIWARDRAGGRRELALVADVKRGRGTGRGNWGGLERVGRAQIRPSPSAFNACHAGYPSLVSRASLKM